MILPGDKVVVAISGGSDSVGLLHLLLNLKNLDLELTAAHYNHKLRGDESERDALFVEQLAKKLGIEFEYGEAGSEVYNNRKGLSPEDASRISRYKIFKECFKKTQS